MLTSVQLRPLPVHPIYLSPVVGRGVELYCMVTWLPLFPLSYSDSLSFAVVSN